MEYRFSAELKDGYLHVKVQGDNTVTIVRRWVSDGLEACRRHRCGKVLVEECLQGESLDDRDTFMVVVEGARAALTVVTHMAYVDINPEHSKDINSFAEYVATLRGINMRVFDDVGEAEKWLASATREPGNR